MPQIEGLYVVEFGDVAIGGQTYTYWNGGVAVLETNRIFGGDSATITSATIRSRIANLKRPKRSSSTIQLGRMPSAVPAHFNVKVQATTTAS